MTAVRAALGALVVLVVAVPALAVEETWRGHPMIDQVGQWWMIPAGVTLLAFLLGGIIAAGSLSYRTWMGAVAGAVAAAVLVVADMFRRIAIVHESLSIPVAHLWVTGAVCGVAASSLGGYLSGLLRGLPPVGAMPALPGSSADLSPSDSVWSPPNSRAPDSESERRH